MIKGLASHSISRSSTCTFDLSPSGRSRVRFSRVLSPSLSPFGTLSLVLSYIASSIPDIIFTSSSALSLSLSATHIQTYAPTHTHTHGPTPSHTHYFSPSLSASFSFFLPRVFCQEPSRAEASRTALKQKRSDVKCDYESCESSSRTRMLR